MAADIDAWQRTNQQIAEQLPVHRPHEDMPKAGHRRQRHRVGDIAADNARSGQQRIQPEQSRHAHRACADRTQGYQRSDHTANEDGNRHDVTLAPVFACTHPAHGLQLLLEQNRQCGEDQRDAERADDKATDLSAIDANRFQHSQREQSGGNAASRHPADQFPVHIAAPGMHNNAGAFGDGGIQQIGAHRRCRRHAEHQHQQRRHQRSTTDTGESDDDADHKSRKSVPKFHMICQVLAAHAAGNRRALPAAQCRSAPCRSAPWRRHSGPLKLSES